MNSKLALITFDIVYGVSTVAFNLANEFNNNPKAIPDANPQAAVSQDISRAHFITDNHHIYRPILQQENKHYDLFHVNNQYTNY